MTNIFFKNDIYIRNPSPNLAGNVFTVTFWTDNLKRSCAASYDGANYVNCRLTDDGVMEFILKDHDMGVGTLKAQIVAHIADEDGYIHKVVSVKEYGVKLCVSPNVSTDNGGTDSGSCSCACKDYEAGENVTITEKDGTYYINAEADCNHATMGVNDIDNLVNIIIRNNE